MLRFRTILEADATQAWIDKTSKEELQNYLRTHNPTPKVREQILAAIQRGNGSKSPTKDQTGTELPPMDKNILIGKQFKSKKYGDIWTVMMILNGGQSVQMKSQKGKLMIFTTEKLYELMNPI